MTADKAVMVAEMRTRTIAKLKKRELGPIPGLRGTLAIGIMAAAARAKGFGPPGVKVSNE